MYYLFEASNFLKSWSTFDPMPFSDASLECFNIIVWAEIIFSNSKSFSFVGFSGTSLNLE